MTDEQKIFGTPSGMAPMALGTSIQLSAPERMVIENIRKMQPEAQKMMLDASTNLARSLPAERVALRLVRAPK